MKDRVMQALTILRPGEATLTERPVPTPGPGEVAVDLAEVGSGVESLAIGTAVTVLPYFNCGTCRACRSGRPNACPNNQTMGVQREGAMTSRVVVPAAKIIPVDRLAQRDLALV